MSRPKKSNRFKLVLVSFSLVLISLGFFNLKSRPTPTVKVLAVSYEAEEEILFWENILIKNPSYVEALIRLSFLEAKRGNFTIALDYFLTANKLSPNSKNVIEAKKSLGF